MADFLPEVIETEPEALKENQESEEEEDDYVDEVQVKIQEEDIFNKEEVKEEVVEEPLKIKEVIDKPEKPEKPKKEKKKRVMTEEHKQKLALAREKALATRRANAARKKEIKQLQKEEEEQKYNQLKSRVRKEPAEVKPIKEEIKKETIKVEKEVQGYSKKELDDAVLSGIMKYDSLRKARKKKKQEEQSIEAKEERVKQHIAKAVNHSIQEDPYNFFDNCY